MDPLTIGMIGTMGVTSLVNLYNAEKSRGADRKRLKEIRELFDKIKPPDYDVSIDAPPEYHKAAIESPKYSGPMAAPVFDTSRLTPEDLKLVGKYTPELAPYIAEAAPELIQQSSQAREGLDVQRKALQKFMQMGDTGDDAISAQAAAMAQKQAGQAAKSRQDALLQGFQRRGMGDSGLQLAAQLGAGQAGNEMQAMAQMQAASDAQRRRLESLSQGASLGRQIYGQEMDLAGQNANIINQFNQRMANARRNYEMSRADDLNRASMYNLGVEQGLSNQNVQNRNQAQRDDRSRMDRLTQYGAEWGRGERDRGDRIAQQTYNDALREREYQNQLADREATWAANQRRQRNDLASQTYRNQIDWAQGASGVRNEERSAARQADQDRIAAMQGLSNAAVSGMSGYQDDQRYQQGQLAQDDRQFYSQNRRFMTPEERKKRRADYEW